MLEGRLDDSLSSGLQTFCLVHAPVLYYFMRWSDRCFTRRHSREVRKQKFIVLRSPSDRRQSTPCGAPWESHQARQDKKKEMRERFRPQSLLGFLWVGKKDKVSSLGLASVNNFSWFWALVTWHVARHD